MFIERPDIHEYHAASTKLAPTGEEWFCLSLSVAHSLQTEHFMEVKYLFRVVCGIPRHKWESIKSRTLKTVRVIIRRILRVQLWAKKPVRTMGASWPKMGILASDQSIDSVYRLSHDNTPLPPFSL